MVEPIQPLVRPVIERTRARTRPATVESAQRASGEVTPELAPQPQAAHPAHADAAHAAQGHATDRIPARALTAGLGFERPARRLSWGWWVALAVALAFFLAATAALWMP